MPSSSVRSEPFIRLIKSVIDGEPPAGESPELSAAN
jgi:hypothetical protein